MISLISAVVINSPGGLPASTLGLIKPLGWRRDLYFMGGDISWLLSNHISVKRWSKITGVPAKKLLAELQASRHEASIEGVLYKRTTELDSLLDSFSRG